MPTMDALPFSPELPSPTEFETFDSIIPVLLPAAVLPTAGEAVPDADVTVAGASEEELATPLLVLAPSSNASMPEWVVCCAVS